MATLKNWKDAANAIFAVANDIAAPLGGLELVAQQVDEWRSLTLTGARIKITAKAKVLVPELPDALYAANFNTPGMIVAEAIADLSDDGSVTITALVIDD